MNPTMHGRIEHRFLINYRVDADVASDWLPAGLRPRLVDGSAVAGICIIRLSRLRPGGLPAWAGITTDNAAHRIAVERDGSGSDHGVYIQRRDTSSRLTQITGGRWFPGLHHHAHFVNDTRGEHRDIAMQSDDGTVRVEIESRPAKRCAGSVFHDVADAVEFFLHDPLGFSPGRRAGSYDVMELVADRWELRPLAVEHVASSVFDDPARFPTGSVTFDSAFAMQPTDALWIPHRRFDTRYPNVQRVALVG